MVRRIVARWVATMRAGEEFANVNSSVNPRAVQGRRATAAVLLVLFVAYFGLCCFTGGSTAVDTYDGAYNCNVARSLANSGVYGLWDYDLFVVWPVEVTTGPAMILPIAGGYWLFGDGPFTPNIVCSLLSVLSLGGLCWACRHSLRSGAAVVSLAIAVTVVVTIAVKRFAAFWRPRGDCLAGLLVCTATVVAFGRHGADGGAVRRWLLAGVLGGLAISCKLISLIPVLCLAGVILGSRHGSASRLRAFTLWTMGCLAVLLTSEAYRLYELGSWQAYGENWSEFRAFFRAPGSGLGTVQLERTAIVAAHAEWYIHRLGWFAFVYLLPLVTLPLLLLRCLRNSADISSRVATALGVQVLALLGWWFFISELGWIRQILPAFVILPFYAHFAWVGLESGKRRGGRLRRSYVLVWFACLVAGFVGSPKGTWAIPTPRASVEPRTSSLFEAAAKIREMQVSLPKTRYWGSGWWRHWDLQLLADIRLENLLARPPKEPFSTCSPNVLLTSDYFNWEHDPLTEAVLEANRSHCIYRNEYFAFYALKTSPYGDAPPVIVDYGPKRVSRRIPFNPQPDGKSAVWVLTEHAASPYLGIRWNGRLLETQVHTNEVLTASVPQACVADAKSARLDVYDSLTGAVSEARELVFESPAGAVPPPIADYGPRTVHSGEVFNPQPDGGSALWVRAEASVSPHVVIRWNGRALKTDTHGNCILTAAVPREWTVVAGRVELELYDTRTKQASSPVELVLEPAP